MFKRKNLLFPALTCFLLLLISSSALAESDEHFVNFSSLRLADFSMGYGYRITEHNWLVLNFDNLGYRDPLRLSGSFVFEVPRRFLIWTLYGGGGINYRVGERGGIHLIAGSEFLWFFSEYEFAFPDSQGYIRGGFRLRF